MDEPNGNDILRRIIEFFLWERKRDVNYFGSKTRKIRPGCNDPVSTKYPIRGSRNWIWRRTNGSGRLVQFWKNPWVISINADPTEPKCLARYDLNGEYFGCGIKKILLVVPNTKRFNHTGGEWFLFRSKEIFLNRRNIIRINPMSGTSSWMKDQIWKMPMNQKICWDTNDLRGKIQESILKNDGTYTIPKGILFFPKALKRREPDNFNNHGSNRNPWGFLLDSETGYNVLGRNRAANLMLIRLGTSRNMII